MPERTRGRRRQGQVTGSGVTGVILAGGLARRMGGGDKGLIALAGRPILAHVIGRLGPQVDSMLLNANGDPERFAEYELPVMADPVADFPGPLAGVLAGMMWARVNDPQAEWIASVASDTPFFPRDLVRRLREAVAREGADMACAASGGRNHPVFGLWPVRLEADLRRALVEEGIRKVDLWTARYRLAVAAFPADPVDPFFNANRPEDIREAERLMGEGAA